MGQEELGRLTGFSIASFLQLVCMEEKTCKLGIRSQKKRGDFYFDNGRLFHAFYDGVNGEEAARAMIRLKNMEISLQNLPEEKPKPTIQDELMSLILNSAVAEDHDDDTVMTAQNIVPRRAQKKNGKKKPIVVEKGNLWTQVLGATETAGPKVRLSDIEKKLEIFETVDGFMAVGVFTPQGELVSEFNPTGQKIAQLGALANEVLLASQRATEVMEVGRGNMIHIQAGKAQVIARCLNEATDFAVTKKGRAHIHMVLLIEKEGSLAMGKMKLAGVIEDIAAAFR